MNHVKKADGINEEDIIHSSLRYEEHIITSTAQGKLKPLGQGVLIWDETKVYTIIIINLLYYSYFESSLLYRYNHILCGIVGTRL